VSLLDVILVDASDQAIGTSEKMAAHEKGLLHRAFSVFIFNKKGEMLLQRRAISKYHSGGLWTYACCSHPFPEEETLAAAKRRLREEMGFETPIDKIFDFVYRAELDNGLIEHEFDHVFAGEYEGAIILNKEEAMDYCYRKMNDVAQNLEDHPQKYTAWFHLAFPKIESWWKKHYASKA
jgi:isopentenyl-diphosphate delta-isomerase